MALEINKVNPQIMKGQIMQLAVQLVGLANLIKRLEIIEETENSSRAGFRHEDVKSPIQEMAKILADELRTNPTKELVTQVVEFADTVDVIHALEEVRDEDERIGFRQSHLPVKSENKVQEQSQKLASVLRAQLYNILIPVKPLPQLAA